MWMSGFLDLFLELMVVIRGLYGLAYGGGIQVPLVH